MAMEATQQKTSAIDTALEAARLRQNRLAAMRTNEPQIAANTAPAALDDDVVDFRAAQQQARIRAGIGLNVSPVADLGDATIDDDDVANNNLAFQSAERDIMASEEAEEKQGRLAGLKSRVRAQTQQAASKAVEKAKEEALEYAREAIGNTLGPGVAGGDSAGEDGYISFVLSYVVSGWRLACTAFPPFETLVRSATTPPGNSQIVGGGIIPSIADAIPGKLTLKHPESGAAILGQLVLLVAVITVISFLVVFILIYPAAYCHAHAVICPAAKVIEQFF